MPRQRKAPLSSVPPSALGGAEGEGEDGWCGAPDGAPFPCGFQLRSASVRVGARRREKSGLSAPLPVRSLLAGHVLLGLCARSGSLSLSPSTLSFGCEVGDSLLALNPGCHSQPYGFTYVYPCLYDLSLINKLHYFEGHLFPAGTVTESILHPPIMRFAFFFSFNTCILCLCVELNLLSWCSLPCPTTVQGCDE